MNNKDHVNKKRGVNIEENNLRIGYHVRIKRNHVNNRKSFKKKKVLRKKIVLRKKNNI